MYPGFCILPESMFPCLFPDKCECNFTFSFRSSRETIFPIRQITFHFLQDVVSFGKFSSKLLYCCHNNCILFGYLFQFGKMTKRNSDKRKFTKKKAENFRITFKKIVFPSNYYYYYYCIFYENKLII